MLKLKHKNVDYMIYNIYNVFLWLHIITKVILIVQSITIAHIYINYVIYNPR